MICPFFNGTQFMPVSGSEARSSAGCLSAHCPMGNECADFGICLRCPLFPEQLREHLVEIEIHMVREHKATEILAF